MLLKKKKKKKNPHCFMQTNSLGRLREPSKLLLREEASGFHFGRLICIHTNVINLHVLLFLGLPGTYNNANFLPVEGNNTRASLAFSILRCKVRKSYFHTYFVTFIFHFPQ